MYQETRSATPIYARKTLGCVVAVLFFIPAVLWPGLARGGDGFHGGGFSAFHGGGFHAGFPALHGGGFHPGFREFHDDRFNHHGFRRGFVVVPTFDGWWWGGGWGWPYYYYPSGGYYGYGPYPWYWCSDPPGYYPYVAQCNTAWQTVPAS